MTTKEKVAGLVGGLGHSDKAEGFEITTYDGHHLPDDLTAALEVCQKATAIGVEVIHDRALACQYCRNILQQPPADALKG